MATDRAHTNSCNVPNAGGCFTPWCRCWCHHGTEGLAMIVAEHWEPDLVGLLDPEQELETIEVGDRVAWFATAWFGVATYSKREDRERSAVLELVGEVAEATSRRGLPFPPEWWPGPAGEEWR